MTLTDVLKLLTFKDGFECGNPVSDSDIGNIESKLDVEFPDQYKEFIKNYGYASWFGGCIFGESKDEYFDVTINTLEARAEKLPEDFQLLPSGTIVLNRYSGGGYYILFCKGTNREGQVSLILDETFYEEDNSWESFEDFLVDMYLSDKN